MRLALRLERGIKFLSKKEKVFNTLRTIDKDTIIRLV